MHRSSLSVGTGFQNHSSPGSTPSPFIDCSGDISAIFRRIEASVLAVVDWKGIPVVFGGEHTVSLAPIRVLAKTVLKPIGIVQIDAHADLRESFEGLPTAMPVSCAGPWKNVVAGCFSSG